MRALLLILILTLVPLQFSAASQAECCGHGAIPTVTVNPLWQSMHDAASGSVAKVSSHHSGDHHMSGDADCGACHAHCAAALAVTHSTMVEPVGTGQAEHPARYIPTLWDEQPYRPQWIPSRERGIGVFA